jgi:hypothetical protein
MLSEVRPGKFSLDGLVQVVILYYVRQVMSCYVMLVQTKSCYKMLGYVRPCYAM